MNSKNNSISSLDNSSIEDLGFCEPRDESINNIEPIEEIQKNTEENSSKCETTLFDLIGGEKIVEQVVDKIYEEMVKDFDLDNVKRCSQKRISLLKKQQKVFLTELLGGPTMDPTGNVRNARKRNNAPNFRFFIRVLKKAFEECEIKQDLIQKISIKLQEI